MSRRTSRLLGSDDVERLDTARTLLEGWTVRDAGRDRLGVGRRTSPTRAATALFNVWMHFFLVDALSRTSSPPSSFDLCRLDDNQIVRDRLRAC